MLWNLYVSCEAATAIQTSIFQKAVQLQQTNLCWPVEPKLESQRHMFPFKAV